jgi:hypothetical protein
MFLLPSFLSSPLISLNIIRKFALVSNSLSIRRRARSTQTVQSLGNVWSDDGNASYEAGDCSEEVAKQYQYSVQLDQKPEERPTHKYESNAERESGGAFPFLFASEEGESLLCADDEG